MSVRLLPAVANGRLIDPVALRGCRTAGMPVGRCDCGGLVELLDVTTTRRVVWLTLRCPRCGIEAAFPGDLPALEPAAA